MMAAGAALGRVLVSWESQDDHASQVLQTRFIIAYVMQ